MKGKEKVSDKIKALNKYKWNCLIRKRGYLEAYKKWRKLVMERYELELTIDKIDKNGKDKCIRKIESLTQEISVIQKDYKTDFMPNPDTPDIWGGMRADDFAIKKIEKFNLLNDWGVKMGNLPKYLLSNEYGVFVIKMDSEREIIEYKLGKILDKEKDSREDRELKGLKKKSSSSQEKTRERRLRVFDLRNSQPPLEFEKIALRMLPDYGNISAETVKKSVDRDYRIVFEDIEGIPYQERGEIDISKYPATLPCHTCEDREYCLGKSPREYHLKPCAKVEVFLSQFEAKRKEVLFDKGVTDVIPYDILREKRQRKRNQRIENEESSFESRPEAKKDCLSCVTYDVKKNICKDLDKKCNYKRLTTSKTQ